MTENALIDAPKPKGIPADVPFLRTVKSYVLRAGRTTIGQAKAYELYGPANLLYYTPQPLDASAAFGRTRPRLQKELYPRSTGGR